MNPMMKAVRLHAFGGPDVLRYEEAPRPALSHGDVLVRVHAVGLNPPDWYLRDGYRSLPPEWRPEPAFPLILGSDVSGVVAAVAEGVEGFAVGDAVYALVRFPGEVMKGSGAYAEYVSVPASELAHKPSTIDHVHAAGAPMSLLTAWQFLIEPGHQQPNPFQPFAHVPVPLEGKTVLINGAAGGVGHLAVQLATWRGAHVIAVASRRSEALLRDLGADQFLDRAGIAPEEVVRDADLVLDTVGGAESGRFLRSLKRGGALFPVYPLGFAGHQEAAERGITVSTAQVRSSGEQLAQAAALLADGTLRVVVDSIFPLADAARAHERAARGGIQGKIVLDVA
ncbi:NADP-dependent oxidoreductase [Ancylobacter lacus]|uniref:NADP-dependent oxidoreductase n=1 Tax=Ancylobacter lacus TaxID=2579970 RepID=UPI001BCB3407|nr:NADP-dependent oxidoreductase [Ancylobacter lacus]MBS7539852.1 NADP-dependent oxidoreductase [Ancylobacter lacus]